MIDFDESVQKCICCAINIANAESNGFVVTDDSICILNAITIINNYKNIICDKLSDEQIENVADLYNNITQNNLFNDYYLDYTDFIQLKYNN